jgi:sigma-E factor negative regulatory protein RseB
MKARMMVPLEAAPFGRVIFLCVLGALFAGVAGATEQSVTDQLKRMSHAMRSLSYEGTLVYLHDNRLETLRVIHRVDHGRLHEQIVSLNGPLRTVTREQNEVTCELANANPFSVKRHGVTLDLLRSKRFDPNALTAHYLIHPLGAARIAGRHTDVVGVIPRDELRYGYRFYVDQSTGLPLKSDLIGQAAEPIEQIMFTALTLLPAETSAETKPEDTAQEAGTPHPGATQEGEDPWRFTSLPAGFNLVMRDHWRDTAGRPVLHFVLSDGLASVSVYVENADPDGLQGSTRIGAIHAVGGRVADHQVTIVGEVPAATVKAVLAGMRYQGPAKP